MSEDFRIEHDTMGEVRVPADALWRAQTQRAVENFPISGRGLERAQIRALGLVKAAAARVNGELGVLDDDRARAIAAAADEVAAGGHDDHFPVDVFQTGSGTSSNMNANEVIASLAARAGTDVHPNDHVKRLAVVERRLSRRPSTSPPPRRWRPRSSRRWSTSRPRCAAAPRTGRRS